MLEARSDPHRRDTQQSDRPVAQRQKSGRFDRWRQYANVIQNTDELLEIEYIKNNVTIGWCNYIKVVIQRPGMLEKMWKEGCQCWYCTKIMTKENVSLEHIHPVSKGGTYNRKNLVLACKKCNSKAGTKMFCEKWKLKLLLTNKTTLHQSKCIKI